jgi:hypothetical protein
MLLIFAEIDFFNLIPKKVLFDETHGVGLIGFLQVLMSANVLSHFSRSFAQVAAWMCCVVGCINMCFGLIQMVTGRRFNIKDHRPGFIKPRDGGKGECTSESYDDNYDRDGSITAAEREETSSPAKPRFVAPIPPPLPPRPVEDDGFESYDMQQMPPRAHADHSAQTSQRRRNEPPQLPPIDTDFVQHSPPPRALHGEPPTSTRMLSRSRPRVNRQDDLWRDRFNGD